MAIGPGERRCNECGAVKKLNKDNFAVTNIIYFLKSCRACTNGTQRERNRIKAGRNIKEIELTVHETFASKVNVRKHKPIVINKPYILRRLGVRKSATSVEKRMKGKFVGVYPSFLLFEMECGIRECFRKNDIGIEWEVEK